MTLRILVVHNAYVQRGGEDSVVEAEVDLLRRFGHDVTVYRRDNAEIAQRSSLTAAADTFWSMRTAREVGEILGAARPDIVHAHNTFPLVSPALYWTASRACVPVVQTLHNFRLVCPQAMFLRDGAVCELCLGRVPLDAVRFGCYRNSRAQSAVVGGMLTLHRAIGTYVNKVSRYVALTEFCRRKFVEGGLPAEKVVVKPNFVAYGRPVYQERDGFLFVGRLSQEKGVRVLATAVERADGVPVRVAGTGPEARVLAGRALTTMVGTLTATQVQAEMTRAVALLLPSISYENFPRTLVEAFACGLPVIASRLGSLPELVDDGRTGLLFEAGNGEDLAEKMRWADAHRDRMADMGRKARQVYEERYTAEQNYERLMEIYGQAVAC